MTTRLSWIAPRVAIGVLLIVAAYGVLLILADPVLRGALRGDFTLYRDATARWLHGGPFYRPDQLAGPYITVEGHVMYPPPALLLFAPFTILPAFLWWAVPLGIIGWRIWALRPSPWAWTAIAACLAWPISVELIWTGNPVLWTAAVMALATRWSWMSVLVFVRPTVFPFAFFGVRDRRWWIMLGVCLTISAFFAPMWADWFHVVLNARGMFSGPFYGLKDVPLMLLPLAAWLGRTRAA